MKIAQSTIQDILSGKITNWRDVQYDRSGNITILYLSKPTGKGTQKYIIIETFL